MEDKNCKKIIIVGSGLIGSLCSLMFARNDYQVEYIKSEKQLKLDRTYALTPNVVKWLKSFNLSQSFLTTLNPVKTMEIFKGKGEAKIIFDSDKLYIEALAYMAKEQNLLNEIQSKLKSKRIKNFEGDNLNILNLEKNVEVNMGNKKLSAPLLLACDGSRSLIREKQGIEKKVKNFHQTALVFEFKTTNPQSNKATQYFLGNSILAILPIEIGLISVVWSCDNEFYEKINALNEIDFKRKLRDILGNDFGQICNISKKSSFPLNMTKVDNIFKKRVLLMGDAAHSIHPLSGQGLNLGFGTTLDGISANNLLNAATGQGDSQP